MGCHRDVKPKNILVHEDKFLLADFGLYRFKSTDENSSSMFKIGQGDYLAPECDDLDGKSFAKHKIHRSSDIWSLGCIVLELLTYMLRGSNDVINFREERRIHGPFSHSRFHDGIGNQSLKVKAWQDVLEQDLPVHLQSLLRLERQMLSIKQSERPSAGSIEAEMRSIAIYAISRPIMEDFREIQTSHSSNIQSLMEQKRFESLLYACGISSVDSDFKRAWTGDNFADFGNITRHLHQIHDRLSVIKSTWSESRGRRFFPIKQLTENLLNFLPQKLQVRAKEEYESSMLRCLDKGPLEDLVQSLENLSTDKTLKGYAQIKLKSLAAQTPQGVVEAHEDVQLVNSTSLRRVDPANCIEKVDGLEVVGLAGNNGLSRKLLESKVYPEDSMDEEIAEILYQRLGKVASLIRQVRRTNLPDFRVLLCHGVCHDPFGFGSGLVYNFPRSSKSSVPTDQVDTLNGILHDVPKYPEPMLDERFAIARGLATSIYTFHKVSWLQRSISSASVAFFDSTGAPWDSTNFRFLGFSQSRPDQDARYTEGPPENAKANYYLNPDYLDAGFFSHNDDYYASGIVLPEIGLWKLLSHVDRLSRFLKHEYFQHKEIKRYALEILVPQLGPHMGRRYRDAVKACLDGTFKETDHQGTSSSTEKPPPAPYQRFKDLVVDKLETAMRFAEIQA